MSYPELYVVAVHGGAGFHATSDDKPVKQALRSACRKSLESLGDTSNSTQAVETAIICLEDDPCLNAGLGSNLTTDGEVECDASIMDSETGDFGSIGAVSGAKNPITLARAVMDYSRTPDPLGRVRPLMLVGNAALKFSQLRGLDTVGSASLVTERAKSDWTKWMARLKTAEDQPADLKSLTTVSAQWDASLRDKQDTVGAVALDAHGRTSAGVSSGGLLLKDPGRIGEAAVFGAGCWAESRTSENRAISAACSVSGTGEYIIRTALARTLVTEVLNTEEDTHEVLQRILTRDFYDLGQRHGEVPQAGVLLLVNERVDEGTRTPRLWCAFTTESMALAYASTLSPKPQARILRRPHPTQKGLQGHPHPSIYITTLPLV